MFQNALRRGLAAAVAAQKRTPLRASIRMASGVRAPAEESSLQPFGASGDQPASLRELQLHLPAIRQRGAPKTEIRIKQASLVTNDSLMQISWYDGKSSRYPYLWLRDNCQCKDCYSQHEKKRVLTMDQLNLDVTPKEVTNQMEGTLLEVIWNDSHRSYYTAKWLQEHCFEEGMRPYIRHNYSPQPQLWNAKLCESMKQHTLFEYDEIVTSGDDTKLLTWLAILQSVGFCRISGAPPDAATALGNVINRCSPTSAVKNHDRGPLATFQTYDAGFQTSLPYFHHVPGIQLLHCSEGAREETLFVDGFAVAESIRERNPDVFEWLSKYEVAFHDEAPGEVEANSKFLRRRLAPTLELNKRGHVIRVNYNNECRDAAVVRDSSLHDVLGVEEIHDLYTCLQELEHSMHSAFNNSAEKHGFSYLLKPGDIICTNNWRVLTKNCNGATVTQAFFDWDEAQSKINVLSGQHRDLRFTHETEQRF